MRGKTVAMITLLMVTLMVSSSATPIIAADAPSITLYKSNGEVEEHTLLEHSVVQADTDITPEGVKYIIPADSEIDTKGRYLIMKSDSPFYVSIDMDELSGWILEAGITARLCEDPQFETVKTEVLLNTVNEFSGDFDPVLESDKKYYISLTTTNSYESASRPAAIEGIVISFSINVGDYETLYFISDGETLLEKTLKMTDPVGAFPDISKEGYILDGWYVNDVFRVETTTLVSALPGYEIVAKWSEEPGPDPPGPDPPGPDPPEPEDYEEHTVEVIENEDGSTTTIKTDIIERVDGSSDV